MKNIHRSKPVHSHSLQNSRGQGAAAAPLTESERRNLNAEIQRLQDDNEELLLELQTQDDEWKAKQIQLNHAKDRLEKLEKRQQTILSFVGHVLQKPRVESGLWPLTENSKRKRKFPRNIPFINDASIEDNMETSCVLPSENAESESILSLSKGRLDVLESSLTFWENIVHDVSETSFNSHSNLDFDDSMSCANSPKISCMQLDFEVQHKSPGIDTYSEPAAVIVTHPDALNEQPVVTAPVTTGHTHNDDFWEQLLTENPPSASDDETEQSGLNNDGWPGGLGR
jgi:heat shock transcription factor